MKRVFEALSPYWLWVLLSLPALGFLVAIGNSPDPRVIHQMLHPTGEFSARFMIIAMMASPLALLFRGRSFPRWLVKNRRYFGIAAFGYALFHTILYLVDVATLQTILSQLSSFDIWTGWLAFIIFIPLAITSHDYFVRLMGLRWKQLQRWTYAAAVLTLLHWAALHDWGGIGPALMHFVPLLALKAYQFWYWMVRPRLSNRTAAVMDVSE